jgi:hypothetical protein
MKRGSIVVCVFVVLCSIVAQAQAPQVPKPGAEHKKLEVFLGTWTYEGEAKKSVFGPAGKVTGTETFESLGGFFLQDRWDEKNPLGPLKGLQMWGYDPMKKTYTYNYFTTFGEIGSGTVTVSGNTWTWTGSGISYEGKPAYGRGSLTFSGATTYTVKSEASSDGKAWIPSFEGKWTKSR